MLAALLGLMLQSDPKLPPDLKKATDAVSAAIHADDAAAFRAVMERAGEWERLPSAYAAAVSQRAPTRLAAVVKPIAVRVSAAEQVSGPVAGSVVRAWHVTFDVMRPVAKSGIEELLLAPADATSAAERKELLDADRVASQSLVLTFIERDGRWVVMAPSDPPRKVAGVDVRARRPDAAALLPGTAVGSIVAPFSPLPGAFDVDGGMPRFGFEKLEVAVERLELKGKMIVATGRLRNGSNRHLVGVALTSGAQVAVVTEWASCFFTRDPAEVSKKRTALARITAKLPVAPRAEGEFVYEVDTDYRTWEQIAPADYVKQMNASEGLRGWVSVAAAEWLKSAPCAACSGSGGKTGKCSKCRGTGVKE